MAIPRIEDFAGDVFARPLPPSQSYASKRGKVFDAPRPVWGMRGASESLAVEPSQITGKQLDPNAAKEILDEALGG